MDNTSSFVFYESFLKNMYNVQRIMGDKAAFELMLATCEYGLYGLRPDDDNPVWAYGFEQTITAIDRANSRYNKAVENGKKGGRVKKSVDAEEILSLLDQRYTQQEIAEQLGVSLSTVKRRLRDYQMGQNSTHILNQKGVNSSKGVTRGQYLNVNDNVNDNEKNYKGPENEPEKGSKLPRDFEPKEELKKTLLNGLSDGDILPLQNNFSEQLINSVKKLSGCAPEIKEKCLRLLREDSLDDDDIDWLVDKCDLDLQFKNNYVMLENIQWNFRKK
jgi:transcriptional regulator with XRE-family HTH domain